VGESAIVRYCRGKGRVGVTCKVGIIDYSVSSEYGGGRKCGGEREDKERMIRRKEKRKEEKRRKIGGEKGK
jgi:hypothetical protein